MSDESKTRKELLSELRELRQKISQLEALDQQRQLVAQSLKESEERYRKITDAVTDYMFRVRVEHGKPVETVHGTACVAVTGYTSEEFAANPYLWFQMVHEEDKHLVQQQASQIYSGKKGEPIEHRIIRKDGTIRWVSNTPVLHFTERGELVSYDGLIQDITERKKAEEELKESEMRFKALFDNARDGILLADIETKQFSMWNKAICKMLGYTEEEIKNLGVKDIHPEKDLPYTIEQFEKQMREEIKLAPSLLVKRKDGSIFYADVVASPVMIAGKKYLMGSFRDITERKRAEEELKTTRDYLDNIIENSVDCIVVSDTTGLITMVNKSFLELVGCSKKEVIGMHTAEFLPQEPGVYETIFGDTIELTADILESTRRKFYTLFEKGKLVNWETYFFTTRGKLLFVQENIVLLSNERGERIGAVGIIRDITERKRLEGILKKSEEKYQRLLENASDAILVANEDGIIVEVNKSTEKMLGFTSEELVGKSASLLLPPQVWEKEKMYMEEFKRTHSLVAGVAGEREIIRRDGQPVIVEPSLSVTELEGGYLMTAVLRDVSERKKAEREIKEARDFLISVIESSRDGILITDSAGYITAVNKSMEMMCRYRKEEFIGKHASILTVEDEAMRKLILQKTAEMFEKGFASFEAVQMTRDGNLINVECGTSLIKDEEGNYIAGVSIILDFASIVSRLFSKNSFKLRNPL